MALDTLLVMPDIYLTSSDLLHTRLPLAGICMSCQLQIVTITMNLPALTPWLWLDDSIELPNWVSKHTCMHLPVIVCLHGLIMLRRNVTWMQTACI